MEWYPDLRGDNIDFDFTESGILKEGLDFYFLQSTDSVYILKNYSNSFTSIWCDNNASLTNGRFYLSTDKDLTIINVKNGQAYVEDYFSKSVAGSTNEKLNHEDITDMVVAF
jgi:hypothetical protein